MPNAARQSGQRHPLSQRQPPGRNAVRPDDLVIATLGYMSEVSESRLHRLLMAPPYGVTSQPEHRGATEAPRPQIVQRLIGLL